MILTTLNLTPSTYVQLYQLVMHTPLPHSGHGRQRFEFVDDETSQVEECKLDSLPYHDDQNEHQPVSVTALKDTYAGCDMVLFTQIDDQYE